MSDLDDKLQEILDEFIPGTLIPEMFVRIKQAFADEGYEQPIDFLDRGPLKITPPKLMTGHEFYDRFLREYHNKADWISADEEMGDDAEHDVLLAAKLAAGLTE